MVTVTESELDFGSCSRLSTGSHKTLTVTNSTNAKVTTFLVVPEWRGYGSQALTHKVFQVFPEQLDVRANSSATFRVAFRPPLDGQYYSQTLEVVACLKAHRSFRGVSEGAVLPPWTIPVQVRGDSFLHQQEQPDAKATLSSTAVSMPACLPDQATYQTVMLMNHGDTAVQFVIQGLMQGVVGPQSWQLLGLCFQSDQKGVHTARLTCVINSNQASAQSLLIQANVSTPAISFEPAGSLFFKPTCLGASSQRALTMQNTSRVPLVYQWTVPPHMRNSFAVQPQMGLLHGNQRQTLRWCFAPRDKATYDANMTCSFGSPQETTLGTPTPSPGLPQEALQWDKPETSVSAIGLRQGLTEQVGVRLVGQGTVGALTLEPSSIDFGTVAVGYPAVREITLLNQSGGNLCYSITCSVATAPAASDTQPATDALADAQRGLSHPATQQGSCDSSEDGIASHLVIEDPCGALPARATKTLRLTLNPKYRKQYKLQLVCHTATADLPGAPGANPATALPTSLASPPVCASVAAFSTYPTVMITDIACQGLDKPFLWQQMSCSQINTELAAELTQPELELDSKKLNGGYTTRSALDTLPPFHLDMGVGGTDSPPRCVIVHLTNPGSLPVEWDLQRVGDMGVGVEVENWVEPSRPRNEREKLHDFIVQEGLLQLQPPVGCLAPGDSTTWTLTYKHTALGSHDLSILLAIKDGKQLHLHLTGVTAPPDHMCLSSLDRPFQLAPVPIGEAHPPRQTYCLRNGGPAELLYTIDTAPLQQLVKSNYGYEVLKLLSPSQGTITPGGVAGLNFIFSPLEARPYTTTLPIKLGNGAKTALHISGTGYHPLAAPVDSSGTRHESSDGEQRVMWEAQTDSAADKATWPGFSAASLVQLPRQLLSLSHGLVSFGPVSITGVSKRVIALTAGPHFGIEFKWHLDVLGRDKQLLDGFLQIEPCSGQLAADECCLCRLTFTAGLNPQLFEAGIKCHVTPVSEALFPLQPARVPSINSPLSSPRRAASGSSQAESSPAAAGNLSTAQHERRSPRISTSPEKGGKGLAGAPIRQGTSGSPSKDRSQSSHGSRGLASQNRAPVSRTSSSVTSSAGHKGMAPQKSPPKGTVRAAKAASPAKAAGKASSITSSGRGGSLSSPSAKPKTRSPHKPRQESERAQATEVVDEVIAEHPGPPVSAFSPGSRLAARAPVHSALTASMRNHFPALTATQHTPQSVAGSGCGAETPPTPQVLVLTVEGRVLTADHMRAGLFIQPSEAALASSLLQGGAWLPPAIPQPPIDQQLDTHDVRQAGTVLHDMLAEVVNSSDVATALASLHDEETPTMAELRHGSKLSQAALPLPCVLSGDGDQLHVASSQDAPRINNGSSHSHSEAASVQDDVEMCPAQGVDDSLDNDNAVDRMLEQPDFQVFAEFVLDSACFSLLQESAAGKWQSPSDRLSSG
ncbi:hypothetical protein ABBQ38_011992 [Trebouxia sp. C0009 RCD-2024]